MARVDIWGCIREFKTNNELHPYSIEDAGIGIETSRVVEDIMTAEDKIEIKSRRRILLNIRKGNCNPVWIELTREELENLIEWGKKVLKAYDEDEDEGFGSLPDTIVLA